MFRPIPGAPVYVSGTRFAFITVNDDGVFRLQARYLQNPASHEATIARLEGRTNYTSAQPCQQCGGVDFYALPLAWTDADQYGKVRQCNHCRRHPKTSIPVWNRRKVLKEIAFIKLMHSRAYGRPGRVYETRTQP